MSDHWRHAGLDDATLAALREGLPPSRLWSLLLEVAERRAAARGPADLVRQWRSDRFVAPSPVDARHMLAIDRCLFGIAHGFEAIELSPLAPLANCSALAPGSQNRIVSTLRGTEVLSDPTSVMALVCAERLRADPRAEVRLAASQRCVRAQPVPEGPGFAAHFRLFALACAAHERADHGFTVAAFTEQALVHWKALDALEAMGFGFGPRRLRVLASAERAMLGDRIAERLQSETGIAPERLPLESAYYDGLRFMIDVGDDAGSPFPLADGGAFHWVAQLANHRRLAFVASAFGSQLAAVRFSPASDGSE